ncbi:MAG: SH3 domain-containing protein [Anaerolineae bacterium]
MRHTIFSILLLLCISWSAALAQGDCPAIVSTALETVSDVCISVGRNQACYGNLRLRAAPQAGVEQFTFEQTGDLINLADLQTLQTTPLNIESGEWGIALLSLQANLPDTLPGQNVTLLAFGDVMLENAVPRPIEIDVSATANARVRSAPTTEAGNNVIAVIPAGTTFTANGKNEAGDWLRVRVPDSVEGAGLIGWVATSILSIGGDASTLNVVNPDEAAFTPMQSFYFASSIGDSVCSQAPESGILLQTPAGAGTVSFQVNGVSIALGSTLFLQTAQNSLDINVIEGGAYVTAEGVTQLVPAGTFTSVPLTSDGHAPSGVPTDPQPYNAAAFASLPVDAASPLPEPIAVAPAVPAAEVDAAVAATFAPYGALSGTYTLVNLERNTLVPITGSGAQCAQFAVIGQTYLFTFSEAGVTFGDVLPSLGAGVFGDPPGAHDQPQYRTIPSTPGGSSAITVTALSVTQVQVKETFAYLTADGQSSGACQNIYTYEWVSP